MTIFFPKKKTSSRNSFMNDNVRPESMVRITTPALAESFIQEQIQWEREHPEEAEQKHKELVARAKAWGDEQRKLKREAKAKEKAEKIAKGEIEEKPKKTRTKKSK